MVGKNLFHHNTLEELDHGGTRIVSKDEDYQLYCIEVDVVLDSSDLKSKDNYCTCESVTSY